MVSFLPSSSSNVFSPSFFFMILIVESWDLIHEVLLAICNFNVEIEKKKFN